MPPTTDNDSSYTSPIGIPDPQADNPAMQTSVSMEPLSYNTSAESSSGGSGGFFSGIGDFFGSVRSGIGGFFEDGDAPIVPKAMSAASFRRSGLPPQFEELFTGVPEQVMERIFSNAMKNSGSGAFGRMLLRNSGLFTDIIRNGRANDFSSSLEHALVGKNGSGGMLGGFLTSALTGGIGRAFGAGKVKTTTSTQESDRSQEAGRAWNASRSQQASMLARMVQQGTRNL